MNTKRIIYYASSTGGFYDTDIHGENMPKDAVEITPELHRELIAGQSPGKRIMPPDGGHPLPWLADAPPPTLEEARTRKLATLNDAYESVMGYIQAGYPDTEILTWERQAAQARELTGDPEARALFVRALAATKGVTPEEMSRRILANAESWEPIAAMLTAQRQLMEEAILAVTDVEELAAIRIGFTA
jgi:hypothetical protein